MPDLLALALFFGIVFAINLLPAFGPPTWSILVLYGLNTELPLIAIVPIGAIAAASGRFVLASVFRLLGNRVPTNMRKNLAAAHALFERNRRSGYVALGVFALSPVPSAQLFEAAGLAKMPLARFTLAFFVGRLVSYTIYAGSAKGLQHSSLGDVVTESLSSPVAIAVQILTIAALVGLTQIDWQRFLQKDGGDDAP